MPQQGAPICITYHLKLSNYMLTTKFNFESNDTVAVYFNEDISAENIPHEDEAILKASLKKRKVNQSGRYGALGRRL